MPADSQVVRAARANYLSPPDFRRVDWACRPIREAFGAYPMLVGSVLTRPDFRDVDIRLILSDDEYDRLGLVTPERELIETALSKLIQDSSGVGPIDFQIQRMTEANDEFPTGGRNALGMGRVQ